MPSTCTDIQATLSTYLDAELEDADLCSFESHVSECHGCMDALANAERSHSALRAQLQDTPKASDLFRKRLSLVLDEEDARQQQTRQRDWLSWSFPVAASMVAVAALLFFVWTGLEGPEASIQTQTSHVTREVASHHLQNQPVLYKGNRSSVDQGVAEYLQQPVATPQFSSTEVRLLGWTPAQLSGKQSATFVYELSNQNGKHRMNVHTVKRGDIDVRGQVKLKLDGAELWIDSALGFNTVTYVGSQPIAYVFSSGMSATALIDLVANTDIVRILGQR